MESAMFADRVCSLTRRGTLKLMSGRPAGDGEVIPFPKPAARWPALAKRRLLVGARATRSRQALPGGWRRADPRGRRRVDDDRAGEFVALYGPSGSGKTTLMELIAGLQAPDSGSVLVDGRDVVEMSRTEARRYRLHELGIIGQPQNLIPGARAIQNASLKLLLPNVRKAKRRSNRCWGSWGSGTGCSTAPSSSRWASASAC